MDYFGITKITFAADGVGVTLDTNFKAYYASGAACTVKFVSKAGDLPANVVIPAGTILPVFSRVTNGSGTTAAGGELFGLY